MNINILSDPLKMIFDHGLNSFFFSKFITCSHGFFMGKIRWSGDLGWNRIFVYRVVIHHLGNLPGLCILYYVVLCYIILNLYIINCFETNNWANAASHLQIISNHTMHRNEITMRAVWWGKSIRIMICTWDPVALAPCCGQLVGVVGK